MGKGEFERIADYFAPLAAGYPGAFNLTDDAALISPDRPQVIAREFVRSGRNGGSTSRLYTQYRVIARNTGPLACKFRLWIEGRSK